MTHPQRLGPSPTQPPQSNTNSIWNLPTTTTTRYTTTTTTTRPTTTTTTTRRPWSTRPSFYNPSTPSYSGGGGFFGSRYGDDDPFNSFGGSRRTTSTRRPSSSAGSSDSFGGFLSGLSSLFSGDVGKLISGALSNRGGSGGSSTSGGGLFDTRPLVENKGYRGSLFSENTNRDSSNSAPTNTFGGYPVTRENSPPPQQPSPANPSASHGNYGWKLS